MCVCVCDTEPAACGIPDFLPGPPGRLHAGCKLEQSRMITFDEKEEDLSFGLLDLKCFED